MSHFALVLPLLVIILIVRSQTLVVNNGSNFYGNQTSKYQNEIINCQDNNDCLITCSSEFSCYNATINCPQNVSYGCYINCMGNSSFSCYYLDINWNPQSSNNSLICKDATACFQVPYPPPIDDYTPYTIQCDHDYECFGTLITCPNNSACNIICSAKGSCAFTVIDCPSTSMCNLQCTGYSACSAAVIYWPSDPSLANLTCPDYNTNEEQCNLIQLPLTLNTSNNTFKCEQPKECASSTINCLSNNSNSSFVIKCNDTSCAGSTINCPLDADCSIVCNGMNACRSATFNGPENHLFTVYCNDGGCYNASIHAEYSSFFNFTIGKLGASTARAVSIWFPSNAQSYIYALHTYNDGNYSSFNGERGYDPLRFYAVNGWNDVQIFYKGNFRNSGGIMHCNYGYTQSCLFTASSQINTKSWLCDPSNPVCNDQNVTVTFNAVNDASSKLATLPSIAADVSSTDSSKVSKLSIIIIGISSLIVFTVIISLFMCYKQRIRETSKIAHSANVTNQIVKEEIRGKMVIDEETKHETSCDKGLEDPNTKLDEFKEHQIIIYPTTDVDGLKDDNIDTRGIIDTRQQTIENKQLQIDFVNWDYNDVIDWIVTLEGGKFMQYKKIMTKMMEQKEVNGSDLMNTEMKDIRNWGIDKYDDIDILLNHIKSLRNLEGK